MTPEGILALAMGVSIGAGVVAFPWAVIIFVVAPIVLSLRGDDTTPLTDRLKEEREEQERKNQKLRNLLGELEDKDTKAVLDQAEELIQQHDSQGG